MSPDEPAAPAPPKWLTWGFRLLALGLGALHTLVAMRSQSMNEDGIGYLDLGDAIWQGRWEEVVNTTWSPLYALIVGGVVNLFQPSVWWEFPAVQLTNWVLYALTLVCFEFFWRQLSATYNAVRPGEGEVTRFRPAVWAVIGYSLFIYVSLNLIAVWAVTPDMIVAAIVYLAAGQILRLERCSGQLTAGTVLGLILGVGYLAKAAMFPLGLVLIGLAALLPGVGITRPARLAAALVAFMVVVAPWAAVVSSAVGHATFSDVGRFAYLKHVNGMPWPHWEQAAEPVAGLPLHPPRLLHDDPPVWEFASPVGGTYPLAYDPAWWTQGLEPRVGIASQAQAVLANTVYYFDLFVRMQGGLLAITVLLLALSLGSKSRPVRYNGTAALVLWALGALGLYALVFAETRYVAPFVLLLWAGLLVRVQLPGTEPFARILGAGGVLFALLVWVNIATLNLEGLAEQLGVDTSQGTGAIERTSTRRLAGGRAPPHAAIASALKEMGVREGTPIAFVGYSYSAYWARLARLKIVAEIHPEDLTRFWMMDSATRADVLVAIRNAGAKIVVAEPLATGEIPAKWAEIRSTGYILIVP